MNHLYSLKLFWPRIKNVLGISLALAKINFKLKNEGTYLGLLWFFLEPLIMFMTLRAVFAHRISENIPQYSLYLLLGVLMFQFFAKATAESVVCVVRQGEFIKTMKLDAWVFVISSLLTVIYTHFFEFIFLVVCFIIFKGNLFWLLFYPFIFFIFCVFILGLSLLVSIVGIFARDFTYVWRSICVVLWFVMPIAYIAHADEWWIQLNPVYYYISIARSLMIYHQMPGALMLVAATLLSMLVLCLGGLVFERYRPTLAEKI